MDKNQTTQYETKDSPERNVQLQQLAIMKKQLMYSRLSAIFGVIIALSLIISVVTIVPKLNNVLQNLEEISSDLKADDVRKMIDNINTLAETSQTGVEQATQKLNEIDLEGLNEAIRDLESVISPLATLLGGGAD